MPVADARFRALVAGGGPAAIEGALHLLALAGDAVRVTLLASEPAFAYRPLAVGEPFGLGDVVRFSLPRLAAERGIEFVPGALAAVDVPGRRAHTNAGTAIPFDALLVAIGAGSAPALPGALSFGGSEDAPALRAALEALPPGHRRVAFVATPATPWTLPLYELAVLSARWSGNTGRDIDVWLVTHENRALGMFGEPAAARVTDLLEEAGVRLWTGAVADLVEDGRVWIDLEGGLPVDLAVALMRPIGVPLPGLPADADGFLPVDSRGAVRGCPGIYAAGDITTRPLRQGGLAAQQADAAAAAIAARAGVGVEPEPYRPALRGLLVTGGQPQYLSRTPGGAQAVSEEALWWPPHKIAGRHLGAYLAAHPELAEAGPFPP
jgi:sulfide:quinone oxidoreductase